MTISGVSQVKTSWRLRGSRSKLAYLPSISITLLLILSLIMSPVVWKQGRSSPRTLPSYVANVLGRTGLRRYNHCGQRCTVLCTATDAEFCLETSPGTCQHGMGDITCKLV